MSLEVIHPAIQILKDAQKTMKSYLDIIQILDTFINQFQAKIHDYSSSKYWSIFKCSQSVKEISIKLLNSITKYIDDNNPQEPISSIFKEIITPYLSSYFDYTQKFNKLYQSIKNERASEQEKDEFFTKLEEETGYQIECLLYIPIQHLIFLSPFLQSLLEYGINSEDSMELNNSLSITKSEIPRMSVLFNEVAEVEEMDKLANIIEGFDVFKYGRRLFFKCESTKFSRKSKEIRLLVVFSDGLFIGKGNKFMRFVPVGEYQIKTVEDKGPFSNAVDILTYIKSFRVNFDNSKSKDRILQAFEEAKAISRSKWLKSSNEFAPVWIPDDLVPKCMICGSKFTLINRRHHCRNCGKCICSACSKNKIELQFSNGVKQMVCDECFNSLSKTS